MKKLITHLLVVLILVSCSKQEETVSEVVDLQITTVPSMAKTAKITISTNQPTKLKLLYNELGKEAEVNSIGLNNNSTSLSHTFSLHRLTENTSYAFSVLDGNHLLYEGTFQTHNRPNAVDEFYNESDNKLNTGLDGQVLFYRSGHPSVVLLVGDDGDVDWYRTSSNNIKVANLTYRKTLLTIESSSDQPFSDGDVILETTLNGDTLLYLPLGKNEFTKVPHHDIILNANNHVVFLTQESQGNFLGDGIIELDRQGNLIWEWNTFQELKDLDIQTYQQPWSNSLFEKDGFYYVSFRRLSQVWKINKNTGDVDWKLGKNGSFDLSDDSEFLFQHFAHFIDDNELLLFDNGDIITRHYSRVLSFDLSQPNILTQKTSIHLPEEYFSPYMGSVQVLSDGSYLVCSATNGKILSLKNNGEINWQMLAKDRMYRCVFIEDLFINDN